MNPLPQTDTALLLAINGLPHGTVPDSVALFLSGAGSAGLVWILLGTILFFREENRHRVFVFQLTTLLLSSWFGVELLLKYLFARPRPGADIGVVIVGAGASWYSFPSSHAAVAWAAYVLLSRYEPRWKPALMTLAVLISLSRIYLGVHYPSDVLAGGLIGWSIGTVTLAAFTPRRVLPNPAGKSSTRRRLRTRRHIR